ncbi:MAG: sigma-70 family RNA polymerase sigma factor [Planctomycetes bacterium]|nr:sigma-70 family RNA polymerase sigma factor [Planctomycetota bacterium]
MIDRPVPHEHLLREAPFVHRLARQLVGDEADDVVQQAFLLALQRPEHLTQPRSWLARVVRNLITDRRRRETRRLAREDAAAATTAVPSSADLLLAEECRHALVKAVDGLPTQLREVVLLRYYEDLPPRRIAAQLGVPVSTVWNRLHAALTQLRRRLDGPDGDRRAWLLPLVPFATAPRVLPWRQTLQPTSWTTLTIGVLLMATKHKLLTAVAAALLVALAWIVWPEPGTAPRIEASANAASPVSGEMLHTEAAANAPPPAERSAANVIPTAGDATTGELLVQVLYPDEPRAAAGVTVRASARGAHELLAPGVAARTDDEGIVRFSNLPPGSLLVRCDRHLRSARVEISAGKVARCELALSPSVTLGGIVVDGAGAPVPGASIENAIPAASSIFPRTIATSRADGTFEVRGSGKIVLIGARAPTFAASPLHLVNDKEGTRQMVRIELLREGGGVALSVADRHGSPVEGAVVVAGEGRLDSIMTTDKGGAPLPAHGYTDPDGRFMAIGVPVGEQPITVLTRTHAPWRGRCLVPAAGTVSLRVVLNEGVTCEGVVRLEDGSPMGGARVTCDSLEPIAQTTVLTRADGSFTLSGLPPADVAITANDRAGKASAIVRGKAGETIHCEIVLSRGVVLLGTVIDDDDNPVPGVQLTCRAPGTGTEWVQLAHGGRDGSFLVPNCPPSRTLTVRATAAGFLPLQREGLDPRESPHELRMQRDTRPAAHVLGRLLVAGGGSPVGQEVEALETGSQQRRAHRIAREDGTFDIELAAGNWTLRILDPERATIRQGPRDLAPGEVWELGTIELVRGARLVLHPPAGHELDCLVVTPDDAFVCGVYAPEPPLLSDRLAPGNYVLLVRAEDLAAQRIAFRIAEGKDTELRPELAAGVSQRFEFEFAPDVPQPRTVSFDVHQDGKLLLVASASTRTATSLTHELNLKPGSYTVTARHEQFSAVTFTIGTTPGDVVRVPLH